MTRILVTGSDGQLGMALREAAGSSTVEASADLRGGGFEWLFTDVAELDITDEGAVRAFFAARRPDVVVNAAAYTDVDRAESEREAAFRVNCDAPRFLAGASRQAGAALIHISTDFVFDGCAAEPYKEDAAPAPLNVYGESKLAGESAVAESGCRGVILRTSWLYSPWGRNFVRSILGAAGNAVAENAGHAGIRVVSDQLGCPTSAESLAAAIVRIIPALASGAVAGTAQVAGSGMRGAGIYHFCDAGVVSRSGFAEEIIRQAGLDCRVVPVASEEYSAAAGAAGSAARRPVYSALDTAKIGRDFGIVPPPWQEALAECLREIKTGK